MHNFMIRVELNKLNYKHIWVDINQININYENRRKDLIGFYFEKLDERILFKLNWLFNFKNRNYDTTTLLNDSLGF
jgi:hypothetical protein